TDQLQIFRHLLTDLRTFRLEAKASMRAAKDRAQQQYFHALQNTFKILINSFYGYLGFAQGHFADFDAAARVTQIGRELLQKMIKLLMEGKPEGISGLRDDFEKKIREREWPIAWLMKTDTLQDSLEKYRAKIAGSARNRAAAYELALTSGRNYKPGEQVSYYITGTTKKVAAYENAKLASAFDPQNRDENIDHYVAKLDELVKKFGGAMAVDTNHATVL